MRAPTRTAAGLTLSAGLALGLAAGVATGTGRTPATALPAARTPQSGLPVPALPRARDFVPRVTHPYLPLTPGSRWVYAGRGTETGERNVVTVLHRTRVIQGITATIVHDVVEEDGALVEDTFDWYAQDRLGNVWYLGERTREYEDGKVVSRAGSWEAGAGDARAGLAMPADPRPGDRYRQEYDPGNAEDQAQALSRRGQVAVPVGHLEQVRVTDETSALEPAVEELKFYARGIGLVMEVGVSPRFSRSVLVRTTAR